MIEQKKNKKMPRYYNRYRSRTPQRFRRRPTLYKRVLGILKNEQEKKVKTHAFTSTFQYAPAADTAYLQYNFQIFNPNSTALLPA